MKEVAMTMNYLTGNLVAEAFPETARILYGLSKEEFASEPEIEIVALRHGLFKAAAACGHTERVASMLRNTRLTSIDMNEAMMLACEHKHYDILQLLLADDRLHVRKLKIGLLSADVVSVLFESPRITPRQSDVVYAVLGPHGGRKVGDYIHRNCLDTARLILAHPRLKLTDKFCQDLCGVVLNTLQSGDVPIVHIPGKKSVIFHESYLCLTDFTELAEILIGCERFRNASAELVEAGY